jgi:hypothetical protein
MWLSIIANLVSSTLGLVLGKARNSAAEKLKDGDTTDGKLRDVIVEDLDNIKTKIDALSRKDLLASYCSLKEGVLTLNLALDEAEQTSKDETNGSQNDESQTTATTTRNESEPGVLNEVITLSTAIQKLNSTSTGRLVLSKNRFTAAFEKATEAFRNEALSLPDRIMAAKLRVASKILECLQDTKVAAAGCMLFLEELHNLPAVGETFSTYFKGGIKSMFYKNARLKNVKSVLSLNFATSEFVARFSGELPNVRNWPRIHLSTRSEPIHPLFLSIDVIMEIFDMEEFQLPENQVILAKKDKVNCLCTNRKGQLLFSYKNDGKHVYILNRSGQLNTFCDLRQATENVEGNNQNVIALGTNNDNVLVIIKFEVYTRKKYVYVLYTFDSSGKETEYERVLRTTDSDRLPKSSRPTEMQVLEPMSGETNVTFVMNKYGLIISHDPKKCECPCLSMYDSDLNLTCFINLDDGNGIEFPYRFGHSHSLECVSDRETIVLCERKELGNNVLVYTKDGELKQTIEVKGEVLDVTYNDFTSKPEILVKESPYGKRQSYSILSYNENDEVECLYLPVSRLAKYGKFSLHPAALVYWSNSQENCQVIFR